VASGEREAGGRVDVDSLREAGGAERRTVGRRQKVADTEYVVVERVA